MKKQKKTKKTKKHLTSFDYSTLFVDCSSKIKNKNLGKYLRFKVSVRVGSCGTVMKQSLQMKDYITEEGVSQNSQFTYFVYYLLSIASCFGFEILSDLETDFRRRINRD
jgi:hypothetical protein